MSFLFLSLSLSLSLLSLSLSLSLVGSMQHRHRGRICCQFAPHAARRDRWEGGSERAHAQLVNETDISSKYGFA